MIVRRKSAKVSSDTWLALDDKGMVEMTEQQRNDILAEYQQGVAVDKAVGRAQQAAFAKRRVVELGTAAFCYRVYYCYRGRLYYDAYSLLPAGKDLGKALNGTAKPRRLGRKGLYWLAVDVATKWGDGVEKKGFKARACWALEQARSGWLQKIVSGALDGSDFTWRDADEPMQFVVAASELLASEGNPNYESSSLVGFDATCSGLQHYAGLMLDPATAVTVNVMPLPNGERADIYLQTARLLKEIAEQAAEGLDVEAAKAACLDPETPSNDPAWAYYWTKERAITRSVAKRPVMVFVYSGTAPTFAKYIAEETGCPQGAAYWLAHVIYYNVLPKLLPHAVQLMQALQQLAAAHAVTGIPVRFETDNGLPFCQWIPETEDRKAAAENVVTGLQTRVIYKETLDSVDKARMSSAIAPNFIHHLDALFLQNVIITAHESDIETLATVHDCVYVHPADASKIHRILRAEFVKLYSGDVLGRLWMRISETSGIPIASQEEWNEMLAAVAENKKRERRIRERARYDKKKAEKKGETAVSRELKDGDMPLPVSIYLPPVPQRGDLDIRSVLKSEFFFS